MREEKKPAAPKIDWKALEAAASAAGDLLAGCAICLGPFSGFEDGSTMLLDCAHAFHASCLAALERHLGVENRRCALCRKTGYAKHVTKRAARDRRAAAATAITCAARAHLAVKRTDKARRAFYGAGRGEARARCSPSSRAPCAPTTTSSWARATTRSTRCSPSPTTRWRRRARCWRRPWRRRRAALLQRAGTAVRRRLGGGGGARPRRRAEEEAVCAVCLGPLQASTLLPCSHGVPRGLRRRDGRFRPGDSGAAACPTCPVCRGPTGSGGLRLLGLLLKLTFRDFIDQHTQRHLACRLTTRGARGPLVSYPDASATARARHAFFADDAAYWRRGAHMSHYERRHDSPHLIHVYFNKICLRKFEANCAYNSIRSRTRTRSPRKSTTTALPAAAASARMASNSAFVDGCFMGACLSFVRWCSRDDRRARPLSAAW